MIFGKDRLLSRQLAKLIGNRDIPLAHPACKWGSTSSRMSASVASFMIPDPKIAMPKKPGGAKTNISKDFRSDRRLLPDDVFLLPSGKRPGPTDLISETVWSGIMNLPDDAALTTSSHQGSQLATLYALRNDWSEALGDLEDELFGGMLDAGDCFQASTFDSLHGYYRSALSNLRSAIELIAIGALGNLAPGDPDYVRWKKRKIGSLPFASCIGKLRGVKGAARKVLKPDGWANDLYEELCPYTHSRPDASDGQFWRSNGPIYVASGFSLVFELQISTYAAGYVFTKLARPSFTVPKDSEFLFSTPGLLWTDEIASSYQIL